MCFAVTCNRKKCSFNISTVKSDLYSFLCTGKALRLSDMYVVNSSRDRYLDIEFGIALPEDRFDSQSFACELNSEALANGDFIVI